MQRCLLWLVVVAFEQPGCGGRSALDADTQSVSTGGAHATGGNHATGGDYATGGIASTDGLAAGGFSSAFGGVWNSSSGGYTLTGGASASGGHAVTGGAANTGGSGAASSAISAIATGWGHSCAVVRNGVRCWGYNVDGQLGNGTTTNSSTPVQVLDLTTREDFSRSGWLGDELDELQSSAARAGQRVNIVNPL